jgi:iron complex transport system substrate-binding protein
MRPGPRLIGGLLLAAGMLLTGCQSAPPDSLANSSASADSTVPTESTESAPSDGVPATAGLITITAGDLPELSPLGAPGPETPERIVSLATGVGETLVALGVGERVVGRDETSEVPATAEVVTKAHNVSAERVIALDPDLVIVDARTTPPEAIAQIEASGARITEVPEAWTLSDMVPRTRAIAEAVGVDPSALLATLPSSSASAPESSDSAAPTGPAAPTVAFLYLRGTSAIYLLGGKGSGADALIEAAGGVDVGAAAGLDAFTPLTAEAIADLDPDVLLVMTKGLNSVDGIDGLLSLPGVAQTAAGREGRVIAVDDEVLLSFGPRTGALVDLLRAALAASAPA